MPLQTGLQRRGKSYSLRCKVPVDLREALGKWEIKRALGTSDRREANSRLVVERLKIEALFAAERQKLQQKTKEARPLDSLNEAQMIHMVTGWFSEKERRSEVEVDEMARTLTPSQKRDSLHDWHLDLMGYLGGSDSVQPDDATGLLNRCLEKEGINLAKDSETYKRLKLMFRKAVVVNIRRNINRLDGEPIVGQPLMFGSLTAAQSAAADTSVSTTTGGTLGELLDAFKEHKERQEVSAGTLKTYAVPFRVLREFVGAEVLLSSITKSEMMALLDRLRKVPANAWQKFKSKRLEDAIREADATPGTKRLAGKTLENYMNNISAIFAFAVDSDRMRANPAKGRLFQPTLKGQKKKARKAVFSAEELNKLFRATLYTEGNAKEKQSGRYWVPLLAFWHGLRSNEACQLYTEDIQKKEGVLCILVRETLDDEECPQTEKKLKTSASERTIPVHPELLRLGFGDFVHNRRRNAAHPRLFPDLKPGKTGYFSNPFGKWFGRFLQKTLGYEPKATFHSFRHMFRTAAREADMSPERVEALCGWASRRGTEADYGRGPSMPELLRDLAKVKYADVDLSHLCPDSTRAD